MLHQKLSFSKQIGFMIACVVLVVVVLVAMPARAQYQVSEDEPTPTPTITPQLVYLGVETIDENGTPTPNYTYFMDCDEDDEDLYITIEVTFADGAVQMLTGQYCGSKIYISTNVGTIALARIVGVASSPPSTSYRLWLPTLHR